MYVYICMNVCMYEYMYVCMWTMYVCLSVCMCEVYVCMYVGR